jgi:hypothetical protein
MSAAGCREGVLVVGSPGGMELVTYVGFAFEALEGDGEEFGFAGCEGCCWL